MSQAKHALYEAQKAAANGNSIADNSLPKSYQGFQKPAWFERWFAPHQETQMVNNYQSKGIFIPWPLLAILVTVGGLVLAGIVGLYVQVGSISTTLLLRDADHSRQIIELKDQNAREAQSIREDIRKEVERRELTDLKVADMREKQAARGRN